MRFSVILPLYNKAEYVRCAVESVMSQSFTDWELIIVNDGSTDSSPAVVDSLVNDDEGHNISVISQDNAGVSVARNNGVQASSGDYLCFLDADDWWDEHFLERLNNLIEEYPEAGIYGTGYYLVKNGRRRVAPIALDRGFTKGFINYCEVYSRFLCMPLWTGAVAMKRGVFDEFGGFKTHLRLGEDFDLWIRVALRYDVAFLNEQLSYYNQDVELKNRATKRLHKPEHHIIFNLGYLEPVESVNPDYKRLVDKLRVDGLLAYYMSDEYGQRARVELSKVDWSQQRLLTRLLYVTPVSILRLRKKLMICGSAFKQSVIRMINLFSSFCVIP